MTQSIISPKKGKKYPHLQRENAYQWKGEYATLDAKHKEIYRFRGKAIKCENRESGVLGFECKKITNKFEWANVSKRYIRDLNDYIQLCHSCHMLFDMTPERAQRLKEIAKERGNTSWNKGKIYSQEEVICKNCKKLFSIYKSQKRKFCSFVCACKYNSGDNHHMRRKKHG